MEGAGLWGLYLEVPFSLVPWSSVQCIFELILYFARFPRIFAGFKGSFLQSA